MNKITPSSVILYLSLKLGIRRYQSIWHGVYSKCKPPALLVQDQDEIEYVVLKITRSIANSGVIVLTVAVPTGINIDVGKVPCMPDARAYPVRDMFFYEFISNTRRSPSQQGIINKKRCL